MANQGRNPDNTARLKALEVLAAGGTNEAAAVASGVHVKTISRFKREARFLQALAERNAELQAEQKPRAEQKAAPDARPVAAHGDPSRPVAAHDALPVTQAERPKVPDAPTSIAEVTDEELGKMKRACYGVLQPFSMPAKVRESARPFPIQLPTEREETGAFRLLDRILAEEKLRLARAGAKVTEEPAEERVPVARPALRVKAGGGWLA